MEKNKIAFCKKEFLWGVYSNVKLVPEVIGLAASGAKVTELVPFVECPESFVLSVLRKFQ